MPNCHPRGAACQAGSWTSDWHMRVSKEQILDLMLLCCGGSGSLTQQAFTSLTADVNAKLASPTRENKPEVTPYRPSGATTRVSLDGSGPLTSPRPCGHGFQVFRPGRRGGRNSFMLTFLVHLCKHFASECLVHLRVHAPQASGSLGVPTIAAYPACWVVWPTGMFWRNPLLRMDLRSNIARVGKLRLLLARSAILYEFLCPRA